MMHTIQNIEHFIMMEVVEPIWQIFLADMSVVKDVDDVLRAHDKLYKDLASECMLHTPVLIETVFEICTVCIAFSELVLAEDIMMLSKGFTDKVSLSNKSCLAQTFDVQFVLCFFLSNHVCR